MEPIHRDDLDADLVAKIEAEFAEMFPGKKVVFAGDTPGELPDGLKEAMAALEAKHLDSLMNGSCIDCNVRMENYNPEGDGWKPAEGWTWFSLPSGEPMCWQCPACDAAEEQEE